MACRRGGPINPGGRSEEEGGEGPQGGPAHSVALTARVAGPAGGAAVDPVLRMGR